MKNFILVFSILMTSSQVFGAELFPDGKLKPLAYKDKISMSDTIGGYPLYVKDDHWIFESGKSSSSTGSTEPIPMGGIKMIYRLGSTTVALQNVWMNLASGVNRAWSGSPCSPDHLVIRNKPVAREDHCLTIDPVMINIGDTPTLFLSLKITHSASGGRYYFIDLGINPSVLGVMHTGVGDWSSDVVKANKYQSDLLDKITSFGVRLLDASAVLINYSKPSDAFNNMPTIKSLVPVPKELEFEQLSVGFLGAIEDFKSREDYKALAFSQTDELSTPFGYSYKRVNQETADNKALSNCNSRAVQGKKCYLFKPGQPLAKMIGVDSGLQASTVMTSTPTSISATPTTPARVAAIANVDVPVKASVGQVVANQPTQVTTNPIDQVKKTSGNEVWISFNPSISVQERQFCRIVENFRTENALAQQSKNQIKVNETYRSLTQSLNSLLPDGKFQGWIMRTVAVDQASDGSAEVLLELPCNIYVGSNACDANPSNYYGTAPEGSRMYTELAKMTVGDFALTSGQFVYTDDKAFDKNRSVASFRYMRTAAHCKAKEVAADTEFFGIKLDVISTIK